MFGGGETADEELVKKARMGDKGAFEELIDRYNPAIRRYIKRLIYQTEEVDDLTAETWVKTYVGLNSFEAEKSFKGWIYRIAHNTVVDFIKKRKIQTIEMKDDELVAKTEEMIEMVIRKEEEEYLRKAIANLSWEEKEILDLFYEMNKSYDDIGDILKISSGSVGVKIYRIKQKLKKTLSKTI